MQILISIAPVCAQNVISSLTLNPSVMIRVILSFLLLNVCFGKVEAQRSDGSKSWALFVGPHVTNYRLKSGVGVVYPYNTTYSEQGSTNIFAQVVRQKTYRNKLQLETSLTFSNFKAKTIYHYQDDYPLFYRTNSESKDISMAGVGQAISYQLNVKKFSISPSIGLAANITLKSLMRTQYEANGEVRNFSSDVRSEEKPITINYDLGIRIAYLPEKNLAFELKPFYRHFITPGYFWTTPGKIFYSYGIAFGISYVKKAEVK